MGGVFPTWAQLTHTKKGSKKGCSAIKEVATRKYVNIQMLIHEVGFKKRSPRALKGIGKFAMNEMGTPDVCTDTRLNNTVWAKRVRNVSYHI